MGVREGAQASLRIASSNQKVNGNKFKRTSLHGDLNFTLRPGLVKHQCKSRKKLKRKKKFHSEPSFHLSDGRLRGRGFSRCHPECQKLLFWGHFRFLRIVQVVFDNFMSLCPPECQNCFSPRGGLNLTSAIVIAWRFSNGLEIEGSSLASF